MRRRKIIGIVMTILMVSVLSVSGCASSSDGAASEKSSEAPVININSEVSSQEQETVSDPGEMAMAGEAAASLKSTGNAGDSTDVMSTNGATEKTAEKSSEEASSEQTDTNASSLTAVSEDKGKVSENAAAGTAAGTAAASAAVPASAAQPAAGGGKIVCIDAGHQSHQNSEKEPIGPGASETKIKVASGTSGTTSGVPEYKLTLAVALKLQSVLTQRGYTVVMCRTGNDVNISNAERAAIANNAGAGAFIRIHANGSTNSGVSGALSMAPSSSNPYCASIAGSSQKLAKDVINSFCAKTGAKNKGVSITDTMSGINWCQVPVTIIEMGFMTNPAEDMQMEDENYQELMAEGMADGIDAFFAGQ